LELKIFYEPLFFYLFDSVELNFIALNKNYSDCFENSAIGCTLRDKSSFLGLSLFLFFRFTLLNWVILCKMGWYQSIYQLGQGDITRYNKITKLNLHECLMAIELKKDKAEANKKNIKSKFD